VDFVMTRKLSAVSLWILAAVAACSRPSVTTPPAAPPTTTGPAAAINVAVAPKAPSDALPERLNSSEYWQLLSDISEPGGYFRIEDNYTSNEMEVGQLFTMLRQQNVSGDVYMGVGPEQNFTYIAAIRPRMAFIVDIRRQAVMQHLMYKVMFEMAKDRGDFVSILFGKARPAGIDSTTHIQKIWELYRPVQSDSALAARNFTAVLDRLTKHHGFTFTPDEMAQLRAVFNAFYFYGPNITTRGGPAGGRGGVGGDFADLTGFSADASGQPRSFLSSEENYRIIKTLHEKNLIVPVSGDFGGPKTIRAIGAYLKQHHGIVRAYYVSNVEQYLFGDAKDRAFYGNVAQLPVDSNSVFIRPYSMRRGGWGGPTQSLCPIAKFLKAVEAGRITDNNYALSCGP
jgi:hypothetical protein